MACEEPAILYLRTNIVICVGLFLVSTSFCHGRGLTKLKALDKLMGNHTLAHIQMRSPELHHGRLLIGKNKSQVVGVGETEPMKNLPGVDKDYLADMGWEGSTQHKGQINSFSEQKQDNSAVEQLLKMEPKVECTKDSMKLQVQDAASYPGSLLFVDRGSRLSPLPLNKLPQSCGYSIQSTRKDLVLVAPYDGCFVSLQEDTYVLPLRWWGLPVRMSCPLMRQSSPNPPLVTCHAEGMIVKTEWTMSTDKIKVKLSGDWKPLMTASSTCRFGVVAHPEGVVISVHFAPCLQELDGMYTLELAGDGEIKISCPSLPPAGTEQTKYSVKDPQQKVPSKGMHPPAQSKENQAPQIIDQHSYFPSYPNYVIPGKPDSKPAEKPVSPPETGKTVGKPQQPVDPSVKQPVAPKGQDQQLFYQYPYYPLPPPAQHPVDPPVKQPAAPKGQDQQLFYQYPYYPLPPPAQHPVDPPVKQPVAPKGQDQQLSYQYPYYPLPPPASKPSQPQAPKGQIQQSFVSQQEPEKPAAAQKPSKPAAPKGQVNQPYPFYLYPFYSQSESENKAVSYNFPSYPVTATEKHPTSAAKPQQPETPQGQGHQQFYLYPYHFHPGQDSKNPAAVKPQQAPQPEAPKGQVQWPFFPKQDHEEPPAKKPATVQKPSQPEAPQSQVHQQLHDHQLAAEKPAQPQVHQSPVYPSFYHPYFFHQPQTKNPPAEKPAGAAETSQPSKPALTQSHENQFAVYQYPLYPKPDFGKQPATGPKEPLHQKEPQKPEGPHLPQYKPFYPYHYPYGYPYSYPFYSQPGPSDQLTAVSKPSSSKSEHPKPGAGTDDNISTVKNPQQPQYPEYVTLPPDTSIKDHHQASSLPSTPDNQKPSKGGTDPQTPLHKPPVYCPQYCPSGLSSCCVQIAFHQHLHHILPAKETPQFYSGLPFLPSVFYSGSDQGLVSAPFPQKSTDTSPEAPPSSTSVSSQSLSVKGNHQFHQPPDALKGSDPSKPTTQKQIYIVPHPAHPYPAYLPQHEGLKFPQSQLPAHYIVPSQSQALGKGQVNQVFQHPVTSAEIVSKEQRPSDIKSSDSGAKLPQVIGDPNRNKLLRYLLQNSQGFTDHSHSLPPQPSVRTLQEPNHQPANNANPEPQSFVLLPHGPPGRESNGFNRSPLPSTDLIHDAHHQSYKPQHPQNPQQPEWLGEGMSNPSPENMNDMTRNGDESGSLWHISAPTGPHFVPLPQDPSSGTDDLKPQFPDFSKPMAPDSSGQNVPPFVHPEAFQQWSPAADEPQNGFYQPSEEDGGTQR